VKQGDDKEVEGEFKGEFYFSKKSATATHGPLLKEASTRIYDSGSKTNFDPRLLLVDKLRGNEEHTAAVSRS
jgi:hypothetical protein